MKNGVFLGNIFRYELSIADVRKRFEAGSWAALEQRKKGAQQTKGAPRWNAETTFQRFLLPNIGLAPSGIPKDASRWIIENPISSLKKPRIGPRHALCPRTPTHPLHPHAR